MISFCDKEVYTVFHEELDKETLFSFFSTNKTAIVLVKDCSDNFVGIINYERLIRCKEDFIQRQFLKVGEDIWQKAKDIFREDKNILFIPVFDNSDELVYFCYSSNINREADIQNVIKELYDNDEFLFINELYPKIQTVYLYDLNEIAYNFYLLLLKRNIPVTVIGDKWNIILGIKTEIITCPDFSKMTIYSEGTPFIIEEKDMFDKNMFALPNAWTFLIDIAIANRIILENIIKEDFREEGKKVFICRLPEYHDLENLTIDEEYRHLKTIKISSSTLDYKNELVRQQIYKIYGMNYDDIKGIIQQAYKARTERYSKKFGTEENLIYIIGPCIVEGIINLYEEQLLYCINQELKEKNIKYSVKGIAIPEEQCSYFKEIISSLSLHDKDIVIFIGQAYGNIYRRFNFTDHVDLFLKDLFNTRGCNETWFSDIPIHSTGMANKAISNEIINKIITPETDKMDFTKASICLQKGKVILSQEEKNNLNKYLNNIQKYRFNNTSEDAVIGSIVMNCNPITLGHMYLIENASKQVDYLYIFVVEEDRSFFRFEERYSLVKKATKHLENVHVVPSGKFILSNKTMPSYFTKDYNKEQIIDASEDIELFAEYIAPALNIKMRFAGEEPLDFITDQYNMEMKRTLKDYGMDFIVIPRKESDGEVISASRVRKLLKSGNFEETKKIVPEVTYDFLKNDFDLSRCV